MVLYEEQLNPKTITDSVDSIKQADTLIIGGTSLGVYPAAGLIDYFAGKHLVLINQDKTPRDKQADLIIREKIGEVMGKIQI